MQFHDNLIELRRTRGMSQEELGDAVGVSRQTVSKWETGQTTPEMDKLIALAELFGLTLDALVGRTAELAAEPAPTPAAARDWRTWHYEYVSPRTIGGLPLVHVNIGFGPRRARGIVAIGSVASGVIALGGASAGVISVGGVSLGLLAIGGLSAGGAAVGGAALGLLALGALAVGLLAIGGAAIGVWTLGGLSIAAQVAAGGFAAGKVALGDVTRGACGLDETATAEMIRSAIETHAPATPGWLRELFALVRIEG